LKLSKLLTFALLVCLLQIVCPSRVFAQKRTTAARAVVHTARDTEIAAQFAPVFRQGLGDTRRHDYITNFDFDGDWRGDNNWDNSDDARYPQRAYVYYAVSETVTHFLVHYAVFHPRDYKGGSARGRVLSQIIREGARRGGRYDPTGLSSEAVLAHENDMEGCLVVASKTGADLKRARVVYVETLAHDRFLKYVPVAAVEGAASSESAPERGGVDARVRLDASGRPELYVEPRGHGVYAFDAEKHGRAGETLAYRFTGRADDPEESSATEVGYALVPLATTIWPRARGGVNQTFGAVYGYGARSFSAAGGAARAVKRQVALGDLGVAFRGLKGAPNAARPPWGWFDRTERGRARGEWFFDPAATVKRHFKLGEDFSITYTHAPFLGLARKS
jgi:hypothetical protein